jgi:hypothetical protein
MVGGAEGMDLLGISMPRNRENKKMEGMLTAPSE